jgi:replicative DNA helicase
MGNITKEEKNAVDDAAAMYHGFDLYVANMAGASVFEVVNTIRRHVYSNGVRLIFLDYIQLIRSDARGSKDSLWEAQAEVVGAIREAISTLGITGVVISQLNRGAMQDGTAGGQHVAGSIKLIQDSDVFMGLRARNERDKEETLSPNTNAFLYIEFNRHGPQGSKIELEFQHKSMQIREA